MNAEKANAQKVLVSRTRGKGLRYTLSCSALLGGCGKWFNCSRPTARARGGPRCPTCGAQ